MNYRRDNRSVQQFADDIKKCTSIEHGLMDHYLLWLNINATNDIVWTSKPVGCDPTGKLLPDHKVHAGADFQIESNTNLKRMIEIKFSRKKTDCFHIKINHVKKCIKDDVCLVVFMGTDEKIDHHSFCILKPKELENLIRDTNNIVPFYPWGGKMCLKIKEDTVKWHKIKKFL